MVARKTSNGKQENLTGDLDFFTIYTVLDFAEGAYVADTATHNFDILVKAISTGAQPVLQSLSSETVDLSVAGNRTKYGLGTNFNGAGTVVRTYRFAIEHTGALGTSTTAANAAVAGSLASRVEGLVLPKDITVGSAIDTIDTTGAATKNFAINLFSTL